MTLIMNANENPLIKPVGYFAFIQGIVGERWPRWQGRIDWRAQGTVYARINASRWIVDCPLPGCAEAVHTAPGLPFFCPNCLNAGNGGRAYQVAFPPEIGRIEQVLSERPLPSTRNWARGESIEQLHYENRQHNLPGGY